MNIHLIGIKGAGMTALAQILKSERHTITGSDVSEVFFTDEVLHSLDIKVYQSFNERHITHKIDQVIYSVAYTADNVELRKAIRFDLPIMSYPQALGEVMRRKHGIAVAGSHGKTTSTAMLGLIFCEAELSPTVLVGSRIKDFDNRNAVTGRSSLFIAETCEYREHFLHYSPRAILLTNIDWDHPDFFRSAELYRLAFQKFVSNLPEDGILVCSDEVENIQVAQGIKKITFGFSQTATFRAELMTPENGMNRFIVFRKNREFGEFSISSFGEHQVKNALGCIAMATLYGIKKSIIRETLANFQGIARRFEVLGETKGVTVIDDFAHHPTEIKATIKTAREVFPHRRIVVVFQAHTLSRTKALLTDFGSAFSGADFVFVPKIFTSAREYDDRSIDENTLSREIIMNGVKALPTGTLNNTYDWLTRELHKGDVLLLLGAGEQWQLGKRLLSEESDQKTTREKELTMA